MRQLILPAGITFRRTDESVIYASHCDCLKIGELMIAQKKLCLKKVTVTELSSVVVRKVMVKPALAFKQNTHSKFTTAHL